MMDLTIGMTLFVNLILRACFWFGQHKELDFGQVQFETLRFTDFQLLNTDLEMIPLKSYWLTSDNDYSVHAQNQTWPESMFLVLKNGL